MRSVVQSCGGRAGNTKKRRARESSAPSEVRRHRFFRTAKRMLQRVRTPKRIVAARTGTLITGEYQQSKKRMGKRHRLVEKKSRVTLIRNDRIVSLFGTDLLLKNPPVLFEIKVGAGRGRGAFQRGWEKNVEVEAFPVGTDTAPEGFATDIRFEMIDAVATGDFR